MLCNSGLGCTDLNHIPYTHCAHGHSLLQGKLYWQKERAICAYLADFASIRNHQSFTLEELHATSEAKSFDYRLLNHLLFSLRGVRPDREMLQFLFVDEHLVDIGDDLHDYEAGSPSTAAQ